MSDRPQPDVLKSDEIKALIGACSCDAPTGIRNQALIAVISRCGLRAHEIATLSVSHVDLDRRLLRFPRMKR
jgi:site-specific recombinase XerD